MEIINYVMDENCIYIESKKGTFVLQPFQENIIHVVYNPRNCNHNGYTTKSHGWGIIGKPDPSIPVSCVLYQDEQKQKSIIMETPKMRIVISVETGTMQFSDLSNRVLITSLTNVELLQTQISGKETFHVKAKFESETKEYFYGLGQHQDGFLNLGGREQILWHDYSHKGGEIIAIPFLISVNSISSMKYGVIWDNASRTRVSPGMCNENEDNYHTIWESETGDHVSFFLISSDKTDGIYKGYQQLCGDTPIPPRSGLGFIQCKQRYASAEEILSIARKYSEQNYPLDILVVDWFHWKVLGDLRTDIRYWPNNKKMNEELSSLGYETMISCWPRFMRDSAYYDELEEHGWFMEDLNGQTVYGTSDDQRGALIDTTNSNCGDWYFQRIKENYAEEGFRYWWLDEDEPDISPHKYMLSAGTGAEVHNIYPLTHVKAVYEGHREHLNYRCLILSRASYLGAQQYGTTFWSSDIFPEWDVLKNQIPTALNFCASGMAYWSSDIGGWQPLSDEKETENVSDLLLSTDSEGDRVSKENYPELFIRWFQFGVFCPTFRTHGTRTGNEIWSYGQSTEKILLKYLKLRYRLIPYIYSLAYQTYKTGMPFMRALWMDFNDELCQNNADTFMFGSSILVAPITDQGQVKRKVYLPAGSDWFDFYDNKKVYTGGKEIEVEAPIDIIPLFVKSGSMIPMGENVGNLKEEQKCIEIHIFSGKDCEFDLYSDDGISYGYEEGEYQLMKILWNDELCKCTRKYIHGNRENDNKKYTIIPHK